VFGNRRFQKEMKKNKKAFESSGWGFGEQELSTAAAAAPR
jgi:hypothetical protein